VARPIRSIAVASRYVRSFRNLTPRLQNRLITRERFFRVDALDPKLGTHKLQGPLAEFWSYRIDRRYRVLFEFTGPDSVLYHDVGLHDVYR
jgi:mRNA-degrading endonuclease YafQ of YafQ-DinJ toxin-antitoxin module